MANAPEPEQYFYVGYRELFERPDRKGYTRLKEDAGKFPLWEARKMTQHTCSDGYGRWYIACEAIDGYDGEKFNPTSIY